MNAPADMHGDAALRAIIAGTTPAVLVGGRSRRFGQDKLLHEIAPGEMLVDRPIRALRDVFGDRVACVGACDDRVARRFDAMIDDPRPGMGPIAGLLAVLDATRGAVFLLAGDLPAITGEDVRTLLLHAAIDRGARKADAVVARSDRVEPTIALYRPSCREIARRAFDGGRLAMRDLLAELRVAEVPLALERCRNVNTHQDLARGATA